MKKFIIIVLALLSFSTSFAQIDQFFTKSNTFFKTHVKNGKVNYKAIKQSPGALDELIKMAATIRVSPSKASTYQAFYINAYNLSVIKGVVTNYPIKSPLNVKGFFNKKIYTLGGKKTTLNDLENKLLRAKFPKEARFHFALVCAGLGCPPIISEAYLPGSLNKQLERQTRIALNNPKFIRVKGKRAQLSKIFEWYKVDFTHNGSVIDYINKYRKVAIPSNTKISYYAYDWNLNAIR